MAGLLRVYADSFKGLSRETWMLSVVMLINRSGSMVLPFLGIYMTDHLHFSIKEAGVVLSFYGIGSVLGSWLGGYFTDKINEYWVQTWSLFLAGPLFLLFPLFPTVVGLSVIILIQSTLSESFRPANSVAITKYAKPTNLTRAFSLNRMAINLGFSFGPALGGILSAISYEFLFVTNAVAYLVAGLVYVRFFKRRHTIFEYRLRKQQRAQVVVQDTAVPERNPYRDRLFIAFSFFCFLFSICFFQFLNTLPIFYKDSIGLSQQTIGYIMGYSGFLIVWLEMPLVNFAERYMSLASTLFWGALLVGISYGVLGFNSALLVILFSISLMGVGEILILPFTSTITALRSGEKSKGTYMGLNGISFAASFVITPILGTYVAQEFGFDFLWIASFVVLFISGIGMYWTTRKMRFKKISRRKSLPKITP